MKNIVNSFYTYQDIPEDVKESVRKAKLIMKLKKEEEKRNFPFKKKGFRKHIR